jgi:hypothetical protein
MTAKKKKKKAPKSLPKKKLTPKKAVKKKPTPKKKTVAKKTVAKKKSAASRKPAKPVAPKKKPMQRRDGAGHINPTYAKQLRAQSGHTNKDDSIRPAFKVADDDLAEELGAEVVEKANSGEDQGEDDANRDYDEEVGGPFVVTTGRDEYAKGTDESNPSTATREPFPKT